MVIFETIINLGLTLVGGVLLGFCFIIPISMILEKYSKLGKTSLIIVATLFAILLNTVLGGYGFSYVKGTSFAYGTPVFMKAFIFLTPGIILAGILLISGVGNRKREVGE